MSPAVRLLGTSFLVAVSFFRWSPPLPAGSCHLLPGKPPFFASLESAAKTAYGARAEPQTERFRRSARIVQVSDAFRRGRLLRLQSARFAKSAPLAVPSAR